MQLNDLKIKIYGDGADLDGILSLSKEPFISGFTTNPTLMRKAGVQDYAEFASQILRVVPNLPVSFEVFADDFDSMEQQALEIASWGKNVIVKIPVTNTKGQSCASLVRKLARRSVRMNVTALMTLDQVGKMAACLGDAPFSFVSVFAGRVADTGRDPVPMMAEAVRILSPYPNLGLIWASPRELLNIFQADGIGCQVITVTNDLLKKLCLVGKDLDEYSLETVRMFYDDARVAGYALTARKPIAV